MKVSRRTLALSSLAILFASGLFAGIDSAEDAVPPRVLVFSKTAGFRHDSIPDGIQCVRELAKAGERTLFLVDATEDSTVFTKESLAKYRAVVFLSTTGDILNDEQGAAFEAWIRAGGGYVGIHAAADTEHSWPFYGELVGAWFKSHPPVQKATVVVEDRTHPSTAMLPERWERTDEWYVYDRNPRGRVNVLASLDESTYDVGEAGAMGDHPIAWYHEIDKGRSWYTGGGHTKESFQEELFRAHILGGLRWAMRVDGGDRPAPVPSPPPQPKPEPKPDPAPTPGKDPARDVPLKGDPVKGDPWSHPPPKP